MQEDAQLLQNEQCYYFDRNNTNSNQVTREKFPFDDVIMLGH